MVTLQTEVQPIDGWRTLVGWDWLTSQIFHLNDKVSLDESSGSKSEQKLIDHYLTIMKKFWSWKQQKPMLRRQETRLTELKILVLQEPWSHGKQDDFLSFFISLWILTINTLIKVTWIYIYILNLKKSNGIIVSLMIQEALKNLKTREVQNYSHQLPCEHRCIVTPSWDFVCISIAAAKGSQAQFRYFK